MCPAQTLPRRIAGAKAASAWPAVAFLALLVVCLSPIVVTEIPAMVDYPNHLARMSILARAGTAQANPFYEVHWALYPNLALDLIVPPVGRLIGVELAMKLFYIASQILLVAGAMALSFVVRGRVFAAGMVACLFLYATPFAFGFVNFEFALGVALFALAGWIKLAGRSLSLRLAVHAFAVIVLFMAHLFALGIYGFTIGVIELWRIQSERPPLSQTFILIGGMAAPAAAILAIMMATGGGVGGARTVWTISSKIFWLSILNGWSFPVGFLLMAIILLTVCFGFARGWFRFTGPGLWLACGYGALFFALPIRLFDTGYVDGRVLISAILILPAFVAAQWPGENARRFVWATAAGVCLINVAYCASVQWNYRAEYQRLIAAFDLMPIGSRLLTANMLEDGDPPFDLRAYPMYHSATLAIYRRDAFVPTLFTYPGKQPLRPISAVQNLGVPEGGPIPWRRLDSFVAGAPPSSVHRYARTWWRDFDYMLMLNPTPAPPRPDLLELIGSGERFALYRIKTRRVGQPDSGF